MSTRLHDCLRPDCLFSRRHEHPIGKLLNSETIARVIDTDRLVRRLQIIIVCQTHDRPAEKPNPHQRDKMCRLYHDGTQRPGWLRVKPNALRSSHSWLIDYSPALLNHIRTLCHNMWRTGWRL